MPRSPFDTALAPLRRLALRHADMEGQPIWWTDAGWAAQEDDEALLDAEEIAFYAEGLLAEGFHLHWQVLAEVEAPAHPVVTRLFLWQAGEAAEAAPAPETGFVLVGEGRYPA